MNSDGIRARIVEVESASSTHGITGESQQFLSIQRALWEIALQEAERNDLMRESVHIQQEAEAHRLAVLRLVPAVQSSALDALRSLGCDVPDAPANPADGVPRDAAGNPIPLESD